MLWASQVAAGAENALRLRLYGTKGSLSFEQENPNELWFTPQGGHAERITRGRAQSVDAIKATRTPPGHPEGFLEAFAQLYRDAAARIRAGAQESCSASNSLLPTVKDGLAGLRFIDAVLESHRNDGGWTAIPTTSNGKAEQN
jgi:predicted dehydrogenase